MSHVNKVIDADPHFEIDINTRNIKNVSQTKVSLVQYDHNSERFSFTLPRFVEGHDMLECNTVQVHYISTANPDEKGLYQVTDLAECEENTDNVCCTWLISQNVTQNAGAIQFLLRFACVAEDGTIEYAWHTNPFTGIHVSAGMDNAEYIIEMYADVLEQWKNEILATIKEDVVNAVLDDIKETGIGGSGISAVETVSGEAVSIADTVIRSINRVRVTGTDNPESVTVARCGKNILGFSENTGGTMYGITYTFNPETQEITLNGTSTYSTAIDRVYFKICPFLKAGTKCTLSIKHISGTISGTPIESDQNQFFVCVRNIKDSTYNGFLYTKYPTNNDTITYSGTTPSPVRVSGGFMFAMFSAGGVGVVFDNYTFKVQVEMGDTATEWEPFVCDTYSPDEQGMVEGVTPLHPTTTLLTDTPDAVIECTYEKDIVPFKANKEDVDVIANAVIQLENKQVASAIMKEVMGQKIVLSDISPLEKTVKVEVAAEDYSKVIVTAYRLNEIEDPYGEDYIVPDDGIVNVAVTNRYMTITVTGDENAGIKCEYPVRTDSVLEDIRYKIEETGENALKIRTAFNNASDAIRSISSGNPLLIEDIADIEQTLKIKIIGDYVNEPVNVEDGAGNSYVPYIEENNLYVDVPSTYPITLIRAQYKNYPDEPIGLECEYSRSLEYVMKEDKENWKLLQSKDITSEDGEISNLTITFPDGYKEFVITIDKKEYATSNNTIIYPVATKDDGQTTNTPFWDFYEGANSAYISFSFSSMMLDENNAIKMEGFCQNVSAIGKSKNLITSGWMGGYKKWNYIRFSTILPVGSKYRVWGCK